jgi:LSD1 subclass zinc finger protein
MSFEEKTSEVSSALQCQSCGATLHFAPGTRSLHCAYCGTVNEIVAPNAVAEIRAYPYEEFIASLETTAATREATVVKCTNCGASTTLQLNVTADKCPFCASPLILDIAVERRILKPHYVLPFIIPHKAAVDNFQRWLKGLWFAPNDFTGKVNDETSSQLKGLYIPHWSYNTDTVTKYSGSRGEHYYVTETYTENGQQKTRSVRHTRWYPANGVVSCSFRDVLVSASLSLPQRTATTLEPWDMGKLAGFDERYLSGFRSETYQTDAATALGIAKQKMDPEIRSAICSDIGGDDQRIDDYHNQYNNLALKYVMLPVWLSAYRYNGKLYQFAVNACTGEVTGERPWSAVKITLAVIAGLILLLLIYYFTQSQPH